MNDKELTQMWQEKSKEDEKEFVVAFHHTAAPERPCAFHLDERPNLRIVSPRFYTEAEAIEWRDANYPA